MSLLNPALVHPIPGTGMEQGAETRAVPSQPFPISTLPGAGAGSRGCAGTNIV